MATTINGTTGVTFPDNGVFTNALGSIASSGYQKFPNGLIVQWGKTACNVGQDATITGTFSITFPTGCLTLNPTGFSDVTSGDARLRGAFQVTSTSTTGYTVTSRNNVNSGGLIGNLCWIAIGY